MRDPFEERVAGLLADLADRAPLDGMHRPRDPGVVPPGTAGRPSEHRRSVRRFALVAAVVAVLGVAVLGVATLVVPSPTTTPSPADEPPGGVPTLAYATWLPPGFELSSVRWGPLATTEPRLTTLRRGDELVDVVWVPFDDPGYAHRSPTISFDASSWYAEEAPADVVDAIVAAGSSAPPGWEVVFADPDTEVVSEVAYDRTAPGTGGDPLRITLLRGDDLPVGKEFRVNGRRAVDNRFGLWMQVTDELQVRVLLGTSAEQLSSPAFPTVDVLLGGIEVADTSEGVDGAVPADAPGAALLREALETAR